MARRKKSTVTISLFPFLSILACVIGTLTLLITAMALGQMDNEAIHSAERYQKLKDQLEEELRRIEELEAQIKQLDAAASDEGKQKQEATKRLQELTRQIEALKAEAARIREEEPPEIDIPIVDEEAHKKRMAELKQEMDLLAEEIAKLKAELGDRVEAAESKVIIQPSGSGMDLDPVFVECTTGGLTLLEETPPHRIRRAEIATDETFLKLLESVADRPKGIVIFLVREDALGTYFAAHSVAYENGARDGKLPVVGQGTIDLSVFDEVRNTN